MLLTITFFTIEDMCEAYPGRSPDLRFILLSDAFPVKTSGNDADFVFVHSGGSVRGLHPLPYYTLFKGSPGYIIKL
jgi:hypothetical protein